jgi:hypothetical protein
MVVFGANNAAFIYLSLFLSPLLLLRQQLFSLSSVFGRVYQRERERERERENGRTDRECGSG